MIFFLITAAACTFAIATSCLVAFIRHIDFKTFRLSDGFARLWSGVVSSQACSSARSSCGGRRQQGGGAVLGELGLPDCCFEHGVAWRAGGSLTAALNAALGWGAKSWARTNRRGRGTRVGALGLWTIVCSRD
eukprot:2569841-Pleurochrysis_carterae.AAC.1